MLIKIKNYIKSLLSDSSGQASSRLHFGWLCAFAGVGLAFVYLFTPTDKTILFEIIALFIGTALTCFGVSVIPEFKKLSVKGGENGTSNS